MLNENFERVEDAVSAVKATMDDVEAATVLLTKSLADEDGESVPDVGMILEYCTGRFGLISRVVAVEILNDGVLSRLNIPIQFL